MEIIIPAGITMPDLQAAINTAESGDVIVLSSDITLSGTITIPNALTLTIQSDLGNNWSLLQSSGNNTRHITIGSGANLTLQNITIDGQSNGGGGIAYAMNVSLAGSLTINDGTVIQNCYNASYGGGIAGYSDQFMVTINGGIFTKNQADEGGVVAVNNGDTLIINGGEFIGNTAFAWGGAIFAGSGSTLTINDALITQNNSLFGGGIAMIGEVANITGGTISQNTATISGGGINCGTNSTTYGILNIIGGTIDNNTASTSGGGIYLPISYKLTITDASAITNNHATSGNGGGIYTMDSSYQDLSIADDTIFDGNTAVTASVPIKNAATLYPNIASASTSIYQFPLNNYDINFLSYAVSYAANGGTGSYLYGVIPGGTDTIATLAEAGITRPGYVFVSWNTAADGSGTTYDPGELITVTADITLYAQWIATPRTQAITDLIESVALQETALSHILNAEGEKIQAMLQIEEASAAELLALNDEATKLIAAVTRLELVLQTKMNLISP